MTAKGVPLCQVVSDEDLRDPLATVDGLGWLGGNIRGWKTLCLAAGGGRQSSLYSAAGAEVTVVDISPAMLEQDREVARQRGHRVRVIEGSMDDLSMLGVGEFDLVIHPVSTCYLPNIVLVYQQVARVLRAGGLYVSQHKSPVSLQGSTRRHRETGTYVIETPYYTDEPVSVGSGNPDDSVTRRLRETGAMEFVHRWEQLVGGLCRSGFVVEDLVEPLHAKPKAPFNSFADRATHIAPYVRIKARRISAEPEAASSNGFKIQV
ncbi:MAG: class I SAM-dependent methyltransferase [Planctomycetota bacterium]